MFSQIKDKRVLITGASSGIGAETAKIFLNHEAYVGTHSSSGDTLFKGNLFKKEVREKLVGSFVEIFGKIDILINNAGACYEYKHFSEISEESWDKMFDLHAKAPFVLSRDAFAHMKKQNWGRIINISSAAIEHAGAHNMHYWASKAALEALTLGFAKEGTKHNILVNSLRCGVIDTPMRTKIGGYSEERFKERVAQIPLGRAGTPNEVASLILFLCSEGGNFITGQTIKIAGGE